MTPHENPEVHAEKLAAEEAAIDAAQAAEEAAREAAEEAQRKIIQAAARANMQWLGFDGLPSGKPAPEWFVVDLDVNDDQAEPGQWIIVQWQQL
jgi:membrane protein involved in colicin uptake